MRKRARRRRTTALLIGLALLIGATVLIWSKSRDVKPWDREGYGSSEESRALSQQQRVDADLLMIEIARTEAKEYLFRHTEEMEALAKELLRTWPEENYSYKPQSGKLILHGDRNAWREIPEHPILDAAAFMKDCRCFVHVCAGEEDALGGTCCLFLAPVNDTSGRMICRLNLMYCAEPAVVNEKPYFQVEELTPNWYLGTEWFE